MTPRLSKPVCLSLAECKIPELTQTVHEYLYIQLLPHSIVLDVITDGIIDTPKDLDLWLPHSVDTATALRLYHHYPKSMDQMAHSLPPFRFEDETAVLITAAVKLVRQLFMELLRESLSRIRGLDIDVEIWESEEQRREAYALLEWDFFDE